MEEIALYRQLNPRVTNASFNTLNRLPGSNAVPRAAVDRAQEYDRKYREENRERLSEYYRVYREENRERLSEHYRVYREENREKLSKVIHMLIW